MWIEIMGPGGKQNSTISLQVLESSKVLRMHQQNIILGNFSKNSLQVNVVYSMNYLFANIPLTVVTLVINLWAGVSILRKDRNGVHILIVLDCLVNVVHALTNSFLVQVGCHMLSSINPNSLLVQSPWSILTSPTACLISTSFLYLLTCWNRLVPVQE